MAPPDVASATVAALKARAEAYLSERGVCDPEANAEFLLAAALGCGRGELEAFPDRVPDPRRALGFWETVKERGRRVPLAYVLGSQPFLGLEIKVTPAVLIPRPETEVLVERVLDTVRERFARDAAPHIVDIGTGSGCVPVALAKRLPAAVLYATEIDERALPVARENARRHGVSHRVRFLREDLFKPLGRAAPWADIVVSNPPYVPTAEIAGLEEEVRREPRLALDGGPDGLRAVRAIASQAPTVLKPGGWMLLEFGDGQAAQVLEILGRAGFRDAEVLRDLAGAERFARARLPGSPSGK